MPPWGCEGGQVSLRYTGEGQGGAFDAATTLVYPVVLAENTWILG